MANSITLVGMPGAGKSTLGVLLAKETARDFVDTDVMIQVREGRCLQSIMDEHGYLELRRIEEDVLVDVDLAEHVIATGGSAVYSDRGMKRLQGLGKVVYLDVSLDELRRRIHNYENRGIARRPEQSFDDLFAERRELYQRYADITVACDGKSPDAIVKEIVTALGS